MSAGHVTAADFVRDRFGSRMLALAFALTGIVATMPYIALQLVGMEVVIGALGFPGRRLCRPHPAHHRLHHSRRLHLYQRAPGAGPHRHRQGRADLRDGVRRGDHHSGQARRLRRDLRQRAAGEAHLAPPEGDSLGSYSAYATLALGSAVALFLYPHAMTGILSSSSGNVIRRNAALLAAYSFILGLIALLGYMAIAAGVDRGSGLCGGLRPVRAEFRRAGAVPRLLPLVVRRHRLRRHRHRRAGAGGDHVDRLRQSVHPQSLQGVHPPGLQRRRRSAHGQDRLAGGQDRRGGVHPRHSASLCHPAPAARRHLDHPAAAAAPARPLYARLQCAALSCSAGPPAPPSAPIWPRPKGSPRRSTRWRSSA